MSERIWHLVIFRAEQLKIQITQYLTNESDRFLLFIKKKRILYSSPARSGQRRQVSERGVQLDRWSETGLRWEKS